MKTMTMAQLQAVDGGSWGSFFAGVSCGLTVVGALYTYVSPEPFSKLAAYSLTVGAISCVGGMLTA